MSILCKQCGTALTERDAFCTKCGAQRNDAATPAAGKRFCTKCGALLLGETKFCTKCGAPAGVTASSSAPKPTSSTASVEKTAAATPGSMAIGGVGFRAPASSAKSAAGIPKGAIIGGAVVVLLVLVVAIAGFINAAHRAKQKAAEMQAASDFEKNLADLAAKANAAGQNPKTQTPADINKSVADLATAANALTALAQNANKQTGAGANNSLANPTTAPRASQNRNSRGPVDDLSKQLDDLQRDAPDSRTSSAVGDLRNKLEQLDLAARRDPNNRMAAQDLNKGIGDIAAAAAKLTPAISAATDAALTPPPMPSGPLMVPVAGTGDPKHDWPLEYERTVGGPEADLLVRTGDINNLGFGWPSGFDPFSGKSTPPHPWPSFMQIPPQAPPGTDRIMLGTGLAAVHMSVQHTPGKLDRVMIDSAIRTRIPGDGYSGAMQNCYAIASSLPTPLLNQTSNHIQLPPNYDDTVLWVPTQWAADCTRQRQLTMPTPIVLDVGELPSKINSVVVQIFADDFQAPVYHSYFQVSLNGTRIPSFEYVINSLDQSGPIGKLVSMKLLPEYWPLLKSGTVKLLIDDPTTHVQDGYAVDFVRILVNPHKFKYEVSLTATVTDADTHKPIIGATVTAGLGSAATDKAGKCQLKGIPAGLVVATASAPGYDENSVPVDLPSGQSGNAEIQLHRHQESTAALEQSIAQTGSATIYGIHFDTNSPNFRSDSLPALNAVLGLINNHAGSRWIISGHTDNQGSDRLNVPLSKARAASVVLWLTTHGIARDRLEPEGFGASRPVADNATASGRFLNRRVEVALAK